MYTRPLRPALGLAAFVVLVSCGPKVASVDTAQVIEREEDAEVLLFVRDVDGIPQCPWEVLGEIEVETGWLDDGGDRRRVKREAARLGGHAVIVENAEDTRARVLRFFDPLCNPIADD